MIGYVVVDDCIPAFAGMLALACRKAGAIVGAGL